MVTVGGARRADRMLGFSALWVPNRVTGGGELIALAPPVPGPRAPARGAAVPLSG